MVSDTQRMVALAAELRRLLGEATPPRWGTWHSPTPSHDYRQALGVTFPDMPGHTYRIGALDAGGGREREDAALIVALRNSAPALLDALDALTAERDGLKRRNVLLRLERKERAKGYLAASDVFAEQRAQCAALTAECDRLRDERDRYRTALETITRDYGQVCEEYEVCDHRACAASYGAWATADAALAPDGPGDPGTERERA